MVVCKDKLRQIFDGTSDQPKIGLGEVSKKSFDLWYELLDGEYKDLDMISLIELFEEDLSKLE